MADAGPQGKREIERLLAAHGVVPRRSLGQHFLADPNLVRRIVAEAGIGPADRVVEVGAGTGTLTRALAGAAAEVVAYEVDARLEPVLAEVLSGADNVTVRIADALADDLPARLAGDRWVMVANLPYNVGTPLLLELLQVAPQIGRYVVMVQREVADRLVAPPGSRRYGVPSVVVGLYAARARIAFGVPAGVFVPRPNVASAVVAITREGRPPPGAPRAVELAGAAFGQRRKQLRNSLAGILDDPAAGLARAGIAPEQRAEQLAPADYLRLAEVTDAR